MQSIATKLSKINYDYERLIQINTSVSKSFDYHVIDAETNLISEEVLENLKKAVLTVQSKRLDAFEILEKYSSYDFEICIVLGNRAYLSKEEASFKKERVLEVLNKALTYGNKIWVGTEGVEKLVKNTIEENDLISYYVYGCENPDITSKKAVYLPYANKITDEVLISMQNYLKRRENYHGNWKDFLISLDDIKKEEIAKFKGQIPVGYPIKQDFENIINFKNKFSEI